MWIMESKPFSLCTQIANIKIPSLKKYRIWDRSDGSAVKNTDCSSRGPEFNSQQPHGGSQPSVMGSDVFFWPAGVYADRVLI